MESGNPVYDSRANCNAVITTATNTLLLGCLGTAIPNSVTCIGDSAFYSKESLRSISIPEGVTTIGNSAFEDCGLLGGLTLPGSVTTISNRAFVKNNRLGSVTIGNNVTSIGKDAFPACSLYVNKDYLSLLTLLQNDYWSNIYDVGTKVPLPIKSLSSTQIALEDWLCHSIIWMRLINCTLKPEENPTQGNGHPHHLRPPRGHPRQRHRGGDEQHRKRGGERGLRVAPHGLDEDDQEAYEKFHFPPSLPNTVW